MYYWFKGEYCEDGVYVYLVSQNPEKNIYLCEMYNKVPISPTSTVSYDTKAVVLVHEVSHKAVNSKDHFYGYDICVEYAKQSKEASETFTCNNADCLQIFAEISYVGKGTHPMSYKKLYN